MIIFQLESYLNIWNIHSKNINSIVIFIDTLILLGRENKNEMMKSSKEGSGQGAKAGK